MRPELVKEWSEKNYPLTPDCVPFGSNKLYWWRGSCGHEWQTSAKARSYGEGCPICSNARIVPGINDLQTLEPELSKEWSRKNSPLLPTMVGPGSHRKHSRKIKAVKKSLCNQNGITYCEINSKDPFAMAAQIKALFRKNHVYITSENENDIRFCRNLFFSVKRKNARTS